MNASGSHTSWILPRRELVMCNARVEFRYSQLRPLSHMGVKNNWNRPCDLGRCSRVHGNSGGNIRGDERCAQRVGEFARRCKRPDLPVIAPPITPRTIALCSREPETRDIFPKWLEKKFSSREFNVDSLYCASKNTQMTLPKRERYQPADSKDGPSITRTVPPFRVEEDFALQKRSREFRVY